MILTLTAMEVVRGIDKVIFVSTLAEREDQIPSAYRMP